MLKGGVGRVIVDEEGRFIIGVNGESWYVTRYPLFQCFTLPGIEVLERTVIGEGGGNSQAARVTILLCRYLWVNRGSVVSGSHFTKRTHPWPLDMLLVNKLQWGF